MAVAANPLADLFLVLQTVYGHVAPPDCGSEGQDNSWRSSTPLRPSSVFPSAGGLSDDIGPPPGPERLRISGYGHGFHWSLDLVPRFRAFGRHHSACDRYRGADFNIILDQHIVRSAIWAGGGSNGTGYCCLLPRACTPWGNGCSGDGISFQRGRSTTLSSSPTPDAFYRVGGDKRRLVYCGYCHCRCRGRSRLR